jgi:7-cyano-7-deazaguanine synthase
MSVRSAVILLSGGLDSATCLAVAQGEGFVTYAMTFRYGQRHQHEVKAAIALAQRHQVARHIVVDIDLRQFGGSALTGDWEVPKGAGAEAIGREIPVTYVPARNTIFLSYALAWAEVLAARDIFIGVNALDYSGYPDCRPEYIRAFQQVANLGTKAAVEGAACTIHTPLIELTKGQIIRKGLELGVDYGLTISCYDPSEEGSACGECEACYLRRRGFAENGVADPGR